MSIITHEIDSFEELAGKKMSSIFCVEDVRPWQGRRMTYGRYGLHRTNNYERQKIRNKRKKRLKSAFLLAYDQSIKMQCGQTTPNDW